MTPLRVIAPPAVLVIDDVIRTGGTMDSVAWALRQAGAAAVFGVAGAKTRRNNAM